MGYPCYRLVCTYLEGIKNKGQIIERNTIDPSVYSIEMYNDGLFVFVCGCMNDSENEQKHLPAKVGQMLDDQSMQLGFCLPYNALDKAFAAYIEAEHTLQRSGSSTDSVVEERTGQVKNVLMEGGKKLKFSPIRSKSAIHI